MSDNTQGYKYRDQSLLYKDSISLSLLVLCFQSVYIGSNANVTLVRSNIIHIPVVEVSNKGDSSHIYDIS